MTELLQLLVKGVALGAMYSLVALGFVVIYRATGVINFAQGALMLVGAYVAYNVAVTWDVPFYLAVVVAMLLTAGVASVVEALVLRRMVGQPVFAVIMITIGLSIVADQVVTAVWGFDPLVLGDPWGADSFSAGGVSIATVDVVKMAAAAVVLLAFFAVFRYSRMGIAMRAAAFDQEAAIAQGISARRVQGLSWAIAAAVATVAGVLLSSGNAQVNPLLGVQALRAFPAIILGGLDSPGGAVVGGVTIGVVEVLTAGYAPDHAPWLGDNVHLVAPYVVMVAILLVRPYGLFGTREVRRV